MIDWIFTYRSSLASSGEREQGRVVSSRFDAVRVFDDETESWSMRFDGEGRLLEKQIPAEVTAEREPVPAHFERGPDPLALMAESLRTIRPGVRREQTVFDGKRALRVRLDCSDQLDEVPPLPNTEPEPAVVCELDGELLAGASKRWREEHGSDDDDEERTIRVWFADGLVEHHHIPVMIHGESRYGMVVVRLVELRSDLGS